MYESDNSQNLVVELAHRGPSTFGKVLTSGTVCVVFQSRKESANALPVLLTITERIRY